MYCVNAVVIMNVIGQIQGHFGKMIIQVENAVCQLRLSTTFQLTTEPSIGMSHTHTHINIYIYIYYLRQSE